MSMRRRHGHLSSELRGSCGRAVTAMGITRATFTAAGPSRHRQTFESVHQAGIPKLQLIGLTLLAESFARNFSLVNTIPREANSPP
jgi:hypothetical protein